jgi:hypothetical protein
MNLNRKQEALSTQRALRYERHIDFRAHEHTFLGVEGSQLHHHRHLWEVIAPSEHSRDEWRLEISMQGIPEAKSPCYDDQRCNGGSSGHCHSAAGE